MEKFGNDPVEAAKAGNARELLAPIGHTWKLFGIVMILLVLGVLNSSNDLTATQVPDPTRMIKADLIMLGMQWLWVYFIYRGMQQYERSILSFFEIDSITPGKLIGDIASAAVVFATIYGCTFAVDLMLPDHASNLNNPLISSRPNGLFGITLWLCLSISAGICEEIVFRGYLQRQLAAIAGRTAIAIALQAILFGVGHAYEGINSVVSISFHALAFGVCANWRGNIRAGVIAHAGWDILAGFGVI